MGSRTVRHERVIGSLIVGAALVVLLAPRPDRQIFACGLAGPAAPACDVLLGLFVPQETAADEDVPEATLPPVEEHGWAVVPACPSPSEWPRLPPGREKWLRLKHASCCADVASGCKGAAELLEELSPGLSERYRARACALGSGSCEGVSGPDQLAVW